MYIIIDLVVNQIAGSERFVECDISYCLLTNTLPKGTVIAD